MQTREQPVPPAAVEHPVGTNNIATTPVAAATALRVFLVRFDFIVVAFHVRGPMPYVVNVTVYTRC
jgi:hypothetical protein